MSEVICSYKSLRAGSRVFALFMLFLCVILHTMWLLLLYAFQDLWKEWGDSNFQIFFTELPVPPQAAGVVIIGTFLMLQGLLFFHFCLDFFLLHKSTLHVCYVFNII